MFKFIKQYAETINQVNIYPMISLAIFVLFFVALIVFVKKMTKEKIEKLSNIPFEDDSINNTKF